jgi:phosphoglycolate phosphatase
VAISSVILDLDGTLIDSAPGILQSVGKAICEVLPNHDYNPSMVRVGPPIREMVRKTFPDLSAELVEKVALAFRKYYDGDGWRDMRVYDGALEALARLSKCGMALYLATNKPLGPTRTILTEKGLVSFFRDYVAIDSVKPAFAGKAEMLLYLAEKHRLPSTETAYVGDTRADAEASARCGMPFAFASFGYGSVSELDPKLIWKTISTLDDLTVRLFRD